MIFVACVPHALWAFSHVISIRARNALLFAGESLLFFPPSVFIFVPIRAWGCHAFLGADGDILFDAIIGSGRLESGVQNAQKESFVYEALGGGAAELSCRIVGVVSKEEIGSRRVDL